MFSVANIIPKAGQVSLKEVYLEQHLGSCNSTKVLTDSIAVLEAHTGETSQDRQPSLERSYIRYKKKLFSYNLLSQ